MDVPGRRERHKAKTRRALQEAALRMFAERGYHEVTVRDIAMEAGVTERTFFRYFPSKIDLVLGEILDLIPLLEKALQDRPAHEPPLEAVLQTFRDVAESRDGSLGILFSGPPASLPTARSSGRVLIEVEDALAAALHDRLRTNPQHAGAADLELRASVISRAATAALRSTLFAYADLPAAEKKPEVALDLLERSFAILMSPE